jgi:hypothetical protein
MSDNTPNTGGPKKKRKAPRSAWKPGQSGNPGGRPPATEAQRLAKELKAQLQPDAVRRLGEILLDFEAKHSDQIAAAKVLLEGLEAVKLQHTVNTSDASGLVEIVRRLAGEPPKT